MQNAAHINLMTALEERSELAKVSRMPPLGSRRVCICFHDNQGFGLTDVCATEQDEQFNLASCVRGVARSPGFG